MTVRGPRLSEALNEDAPAGSSFISDKDIHTTCPTCGTRQSFYDADVTFGSGRRTTYRCSTDRTVLAVVRPDRYDLMSDLEIDYTAPGSGHSGSTAGPSQ